jgi:hypothetical protein
MDDDNLPDAGDLDWLARLVQRAIEAIGRMDLSEYERMAWIAEIEAAFEQARVSICRRSSRTRLLS